MLSYPPYPSDPAADSAGSTGSGRRGKLLVLATVVVVVVIGVAVYSQLAASNPFTPSRSAMIGTWRSSSGAVLTLRPDGMFTAGHLPADPGEESYGLVPATGSGRWHVGPVVAEPAGVVFDFSPTVQMELLTEHLATGVVMYFDRGDPDEGPSGQYQFTKVG
jgi:hypothetical protein